MIDSKLRTWNCPKCGVVSDNNVKLDGDYVCVTCDSVVDEVMANETKYKIEVKIEIPEQRIKDLLCDAFEGGSNYWYEIVKYNYPDGVKKEDIEFPHLDLIFKGGSVEISDNEDDAVNIILDKEKCLKGLQLMAEKYPKDFADFMTENDDANTGDIFLQLACLGEVIYG